MLINLCEQPIPVSVKGFISLFDKNPVCQDDCCNERHDCHRSVFCDDEEGIAHGELTICQHGKLLCTKHLV